MTSRRERPPSGRVNTPLGPIERASTPAALSDRFPKSRPQTAGPPSARISDRSGRPEINSGRLGSARSAVSDISTSEVLRRMREKSDVAKNAIQSAEIEALGEYNEFSRPIPSRSLPLRSVLLDPEVNNFPPSKTRSELMRKIKLSGFPHPSYDLDSDGYVSQQDYKLAKRFDFDGNGVLDPGERAIGKRVLADEFFKRHAKDLHVFGANIASNTHKKNVENLTNSYSFERAYDKLLTIERTVLAESSKPILSCLKLENKEELLKHNFYTNKFDSTAWNDFDAIPRAASTYSFGEHGGSRKRFIFARKEVERAEMQEKLDRMQALREKPLENTRRVSLITNIRMENG